MKNLIRYIASLVLVLGAAGFTACSSDDGDDTRYAVSFDRNPVMAGSGAGTYSVRIESTHAWNAAPVDGWITGVTASGEPVRPSRSGSKPMTENRFVTVPSV